MGTLEDTWCRGWRDDLAPGSGGLLISTGAHRTFRRAKGSVQHAKARTSVNRLHVGPADWFHDMEDFLKVWVPASPAR